MSPVELSKDYVDSIGNLLKSTRERKAENLPEIAFRIALSPTQLRAIEAGDLGPFYSAGYFLQAANRYAEFLGVSLPAHSTSSVAAQTSQDPIPAKKTSAIATPEDSGVNEVDVAPPTAEPVIAKLDNPEASDLSAQPAQSPLQTHELGWESNAKEFQMLEEPPASEPSARQPFRLSWGWVAFGCAVLIALGVTKISLTPSAPNPVTTAVVQTPAESDTKDSSAQQAPPSAASSPPGATAASPAMQSQDKKASGTSVAAAPASAPEKKIAPPAPMDSQLLTQASTWVQIVKSNGEKINIKAEPGQPVDFHAENTAAVVFGQPDKAALRIKGKSINITPFVTNDNPPRALVILNQIKD